MSGDEKLVKGELVRVVAPTSYYVGMTGRVHFAGRAQCIVTLTATGQSRAIPTAQLARVRPLPAQASGERAA